MRPDRLKGESKVKLKTFALALVATGFMAGSSLAAMQPVANPPEKAKSMHHKKHHMHKKADVDAKADKAEGKAAEAKESPKAEAKEAKGAMAAKPAMPAKK